MVAYAYDTACRRNPVGFFGMVHVLEGTSVALALQAADSIATTLALPKQAFTYLRSQGHLDQEHVQHLAGILNRLESAEDRAAVTHCARVMYGDPLGAASTAHDYSLQAKLDSLVVSPPS